MAGSRPQAAEHPGWLTGMAVPLWLAPEGWLRDLAGPMSWLLCCVAVYTLRLHVTHGWLLSAGCATWLADADG